jgi:hypothetical protein
MTQTLYAHMSKKKKKKIIIKRTVPKSEFKLSIYSSNDGHP